MSRERKHAASAERKTRIRRGDLTDEQWERIQPLLPPQHPPRGTRGGRPSHDHRTIVNGILWILRTGSPWDDLPPRYGKRSTVSNRYYRWKKQGIWDRIYARVQEPAIETAETSVETEQGETSATCRQSYAADARPGSRERERAFVVGDASNWRASRT